MTDANRILIEADKFAPAPFHAPFIFGIPKTSQTVSRRELVKEIEISDEFVTVHYEQCEGAEQKKKAALRDEIAAFSENVTKSYQASIIEANGPDSKIAAMLDEIPMFDPYKDDFQDFVKRASMRPSD